MRTLIVANDEDGHFVAYFEDDPDAHVGGYESKAEAIGVLVLAYSNVFNVQIKEI